MAMIFDWFRRIFIDFLGFFLDDCFFSSWWKLSEATVHFAMFFPASFQLLVQLLKASAFCAYFLLKQHVENLTFPCFGRNLLKQHVENLTFLKKHGVSSRAFFVWAYFLIFIANSIKTLLFPNDFFYFFCVFFLTGFCFASSEISKKMRDNEKKRGDKQKKEGITKKKGGITKKRGGITKKGG